MPHTDRENFIHAFENHPYRISLYENFCLLCLLTISALPTIEGAVEQGERVMALLRRWYARLKLRVNETKSAVASVFGRKSLGYALWVGSEGEVKRKMSAKALARFKQRVRQLTRRSGGHPLLLSVADISAVLAAHPSLLPRAELDACIFALDAEFMDSLNGEPKRRKQPNAAPTDWAGVLAAVNGGTNGGI